MTAMSKEVLRKKIYAPEKDQRKEDDLWKFFDTVNCYSYAIGLLYDIRFLNPGQLSGMTKQEQYTDNEILERVKSDIKYLGMEIRESYLEEVVEEEESWKIAILNTGLKKEHSRYDYHFLRQCADKKWYQKIPYDQFPTPLDSRNYIITNPETAKYPFHYHLIGYFVVSKIKQD